MLFIALVTDRPGALAQRLEHRPKHLDYLASLGDAVKIAGAMLSDDTPESAPKGSAFILEAESLEAARKLLADDPFTKLGIFSADIRIEPLRPGAGLWKPA